MRPVFLCLRARSRVRVLRWRGARSSNEEAGKSAGLRDAQTMTALFPSARLLELLLPRCFTSKLIGCLQPRARRERGAGAAPDQGRARDSEAADA